MDKKQLPHSYYERGETQIGILVGALVIGVLCFCIFSFSDWWSGMKTERAKKTHSYFFDRKEKSDFKKIHIEKGYRVSFTRDKRQ